MWIDIKPKEIIYDLIVGHEEVAKLKMRQLIKQKYGFVRMSNKTGIPPKSLIRMLSDKGNPTSRNLFKILRNL